MRLLNVSVGRVQTQVIDGEEVQTAYVKRPVPEPWVITPSGPAGDEVAVHSDHLYVFDRDGYDYWAAELGVPRDTWSDGLFAENLTVDSLDQQSLRVGDRFRLGTAVLVVTGPRVPCWKLTWALAQPKSFMRRFRLSGRSGAYFGVVRPGVVHPGDRFEPISAASDAPTIATLSRLCDSGTRISAEDLTTIRAALASTDLSLTARGTLELKTAAFEREVESAQGGWKGWRPFTIAHHAYETSDAVSFELAPVDGGPLPAFRAGQHVVVRLTERGAAPVTRTWSLSSFAAEPTRYRITVRLRADGAGSRALLGALEGEDAVGIELRTPAGAFRLDGGAFRPVILIAAGIGITPMIAMLQAHLERGPGRPPIWVLYSAATPERTAFRDHLAAVAAAHDGVHVHHFLTRPTPETAGAHAVDRWTVHLGRPTPERVVDILRGNYLDTDDGPVLIPWFESDVYVCGPLDFTAAIRDGLIAAGANPDLVRVEDFAAAAVEPDGPRRQADAAVEYAGLGLRARWEARREQTLLELAEDDGLDLPFDCRTGSCRTCESTLVSGAVDGPVTRGRDGTARVLLCVSYPDSDLVVVEPPPTEPPTEPQTDVESPTAPRSRA